MWRKEQGQALLVAMLVLTLLFLLGTASLTVAAYSKRASTGELDRTQAYYAANAGAEKALLLLKADPLWADINGTTLAGDFKDTSGKTVAHIDSVKVTTEATSWDRTVKTIVAQASAGQARKTVTVKAEIDAAPFTSYSGPGVNIVPVPGTSSSASLTLENGTQVHADLLYTGDSLTFAAGHGHHGEGEDYWRAIVGTEDKPRTVRATGTVKFDEYGCPGGGGGSGGGGSTYVVYGYVYASQFTPSVPSSFINGGYQSGWVPNPPIPAYPDIDTDTYRQAAMLADAISMPGGTHYLTGPRTISLSDSMQGLYFIDGAVTLTGGSYSSRVTIVARDGITVQGNITKSGGALSLVTPGDIVVDNGTNGVAALLFAGGTLAVKSSATLTGGVNARWLAEEAGGGGGCGGCGNCGRCCCGRSVGVLFEADSSAAGQMSPGFPVIIKIISWKE
ncbi:MAG: hypothetical protein AB1510_06470 [Bacillota bacterium]